MSEFIMITCVIPCVMVISWLLVIDLIGEAVKLYKEMLEMKHNSQK